MDQRYVLKEATVAAPSPSSQFSTGTGLAWEVGGDEMNSKNLIFLMVILVNFTILFYKNLILPVERAICLWLAASVHH